MIYLELLLGFLKVGLFSFGGAYAAIPLIRETVLSYGWISEEALTYTNENWYELDCFKMIRGKEGRERIQAASDDFLARQGYVREGGKYRIERPNDDRVAVFCHQGFSMEWLPVLLGIPPQYTFSAFDFTHACISIFEFVNYEDGYTFPRCLCISDTSYLYEDRLPLLYNHSIYI